MDDLIRACVNRQDELLRKGQDPYYDEELGDMKFQLRNLVRKDREYLLTMHDWNNAPTEIYCGVGWSKLVREILDHLDTASRSVLFKDSIISVPSVKEKFGVLRMSISCKRVDGQLLSDEQSAVIRTYSFFALAKSRIICEDCGTSPAHLTGGPWIQTLCAHHEKLKKKDGLTAEQRELLSMDAANNVERIATLQKEIDSFRFE